MNFKFSLGKSKKFGLFLVVLLLVTQVAFATDDDPDDDPHNCGTGLYYHLRDDGSGTGYCERCNDACRTCRDSADNCTSCSNNKKSPDSMCADCINPDTELLKDDGSCECVSTHFYRIEDDNHRCIECQAPCGSCTSETDCIDCRDPNRDFVEGECICKHNTYQREDECIACYEGCNGCDNSPKECRACKDQVGRANFEDDPSCQCLAEYYEKEGSCHRCDAKCASCKNDGVTCIQCKYAHRDSNNNCACKRGYISDKDDADCVKNDIIPYEPLGDGEEYHARCIQVVKKGLKSNCIMCRSDKNKQGENYVSDSDGADSDTCDERPTPFGKGTYAIRRNRTTADENDRYFKCDEYRNEVNPEVIEQPLIGNEDERTPDCEVYDDYGTCIRCLPGFGRVWEDITEKRTVAGYKCVSNKLRTLFCEEYDQTFTCIRCKWNQEPEVKELYSIDSYKLDYGLYKSGLVTYCINNLRRDYRMEEIDNSFLQSDIVNNCAEYNSDKTCKECHSRQYDLEGRTMYKSIDGDNLHHDYMIDPTQNSCRKYPSEYMTAYSSEDQNNKIIKEYPFTLLGARKHNDEICADDRVYVENARRSGEYGCALEIDFCISYEFDWDYTHFRKTGEWIYNDRARCLLCDSDHTLLYSTKQCIERLPNCLVAEGADNCKACVSGFHLVTNSETGDKSCSGTTFTRIPHCLETVVDQNGHYQCNQCEYGYRAQMEEYEEGRELPSKCIHYSETFHYRGCTIVNRDNTGCHTATAIEGWNSEGKCGGGIVPRIDSLCMTEETNTEIPNCVRFIKIHTANPADEDAKDVTRKCYECADGYALSYSMSECISLSEPAGGDDAGADNFVENCISYDAEGYWCTQCREFITRGERQVPLVLTDANTCMEEEHAGWHCQYAEVTKRGEFEQRSCLVCKQGYEKDFEDKCVPKTTTTPGGDGVTLGNIYLYNNIAQKVRGIIKDRCRYYRNKQGDCYECDQDSLTNFYGVQKIGALAGNCVQCAAGQNLGKGFSGEQICVNVVPNCEVYHNTKNYCTLCKQGYYMYIAADNTVQCTDTCHENNRRTEAFSQGDLCLTAEFHDDHCSGGLFQFYDAAGTTKLRCAGCDKSPTGPEANYFINVRTDDQKCEPYSGLVGIDWATQQNQMRATNLLSVSEERDSATLPPLDARFQSYPCQVKWITSREDTPLYEKNFEFNYAQNRDGSTVCMHSYSNFEIFINCADGQFDNHGNPYCNQCYPGFQIDQSEGNRCVLQATAPYLNVHDIDSDHYENCWDVKYDEGDVSSHCAKCAYGYIKRGGECRLSPHPACIKLVGDNNDPIQCDECQFPFVQVGGTCQLLHAKCLRLDSSGNCDKCENGYEFFNGECRRRTKNCWNEDWSKAYSIFEKQKRAGVCRVGGCWEGADGIRLDLENDVLVQTCIYGCNILKRTMKERTASNQHHLWSCAECRNTKYHFYGESDRCIPSTHIQHCGVYKQRVNGFTEQCQACERGYYVLEGLCAECDTTETFCLQYDHEATSRTSEEHGKCKCKLCEDNYYVNEAGRCIRKPSNHCIKYDKEGQCIACENQGTDYYLSNHICVSYTVEHCQQKSLTENRCIRCDFEDDDHNFLDNNGSCIRGNVQNCQIFASIDQCTLCRINYGLSHNNNECIFNNNSLGTKHCLKYAERDFDKLDDPYTCIDCRTSQYTLGNDAGYAPDYTATKNKQNEFCLQLNFCREGYTHEGVAYCKDCYEEDIDIDLTTGKQTLRRRIFYDKKVGEHSTCHVETKANNFPKYCRRFDNFNKDAASNVCIECHKGSHSDYNEDPSYGKVCILDDHPAALPACKIYQEMSNGNEYQKYENLHCLQCYNQYQYYKCDSTQISSYNYNSYNRYCDIQAENSEDTPSQELYAGKDGGIIELKDKKPDDNREPGRDEYEKPKHTGASSLGVSVLLIFVSLVLLM